MRHQRLILALCASLTVAAACGPSSPGVGVCSLEGNPASDSCAAAPVSLSSEVCRCGVHYYWDGTSCTSTAACSCYAGCEHLYELESECVADHASCLGLDAGSAADGG